MKTEGSRGELMLTIDELKRFGADTKEGTGRCFGNIEFYLSLVRTVPDEQTFEKLSAAIEVNDLDTAFEMAHGLKGVLGNLSLTPIYNPVSEMTELLRARKEMDYSEMMSEILKQRQLLKEICEES